MPKEQIEVRKEFEDSNIENGLGTTVRDLRIEMIKNQLDIDIARQKIKNIKEDDYRGDANAQENDIHDQESIIERLTARRKALVGTVEKFEDVASNDYLFVNNKDKDPLVAAAKEDSIRQLLTDYEPEMNKRVSSKIKLRASLENELTTFSLVLTHLRIGEDVDLSIIGITNEVPIEQKIKILNNEMDVTEERLSVLDKELDALGISEETDKNGNALDPADRLINPGNLN